MRRITGETGIRGGDRGGRQERPLEICDDSVTLGTDGDSVDLCATIKNVGGTTAKFFLRFYDGSTMVRETLPGNVNPGQTITDVCELFPMPNHAWSGKIDLIRQG